MKPSILNSEELDSARSTFGNWAFLEAPSRMERTFEFKNYYETMAFVNAVAFVAHQQDHHPEMTVGYKTCLVSYTTHSAGGLTDFDLTAARELDGLFSSEPSTE